MKSKMNFFLEDEQIEQLKKYSKKSGVPMSEAVRRAIGLYLSKIERSIKNGIDKN